MFPEYSLCPQRVQFFSSVQFMSAEYSLCPQSTVYVKLFPKSGVQFMSSGYSFCPQRTVCVLRGQLMFPKYSLSPLVYVSRVKFTPGVHLCTLSTVNVLEQSTVYVLRVQFFSSKSTVYVRRVQFMSSNYSFCPQRTVYVLRAQLMFPKYSLSP